MRPAQELRPMAMGEIIDRSASFWRANLKALFGLSLGFQVAQYVVLKAYLLAMLAWFPLMRGGQKLALAANSEPGELFRQLGLGGLSLLGTLPVYLLITWFASVAITRFSTQALLGRPHSLAEALAWTRRRAWAATGALLLSLGWLCGICLALCLPGAGLLGLAAYLGASESPGAAAVLALLGGLAILLGLVVAMLWYLLRFFLTAQVLGAEPLGAVGAVRRSGALVSGRLGPGLGNWVKMRATVLLTVMAVILTAVGLIAGLPALVVQFAYGNPLDPANADPDAVPLGLLIPAELLQVLAQSAFGPLFVVFAVLFYLDLRIRREGLDLELALEALPGGTR